MQSKENVFCARQCIQWELCSQPELSRQGTGVQAAPTPVLAYQHGEGRQHHFLPQELFPRWRAKILGGRHVQATGMTLHNIVWCLRKNTRNNKKTPTAVVHTHTPQQLRILAADTIPYLPPKLG